MMMSGKNTTTMQKKKNVFNFLTVFMCGEKCLKKIPF